MKTSWRLTVLLAAFGVVVPAHLARAQQIPSICPDVDSSERWHNCFGQLRTDAVLYSGNFQNDTFSGFGTLIVPDITYSGEFKNGRFEGQGILILADGSRYIGEFREGLMHGIGRVINPDGTSFAATFNNGELVQTPAGPEGAATPPGPAPVAPVATPAPPAAPIAQRPPPPAPAPAPPAPIAQAPAPAAPPAPPAAPPPETPRAAPPPPAPVVGRAFIPAGEWKCSTGYYPYVSYSSLVVSGNTYTTSWRDGTGARSGIYSRGETGTSYGGVSIKWDTGTWEPFIGEYVPAGTPHPRTGDVNPYDSVLVGEDPSYWATSCHQ